ncbi:low molecular weight phosphatase family protein [Vibrio sp. MA40-2]|uniref:arsenate-mycothiol transferase ArsC n=1 Tax=Vibrio sp. MA40-2 TaxID=3391828 RepID=UPI0039A5E020
MFKSILVLCTGNICRSPFAEAALNKLLPNIEVTSAGIATDKNGLQGVPADKVAVEMALKYGVDMSEHRAKQVDQFLIDQHDLILTMDREQLEQLCQFFPEARAKSWLLGHWIGMSSIDDPYQKSDVIFNQVYSVIGNAVRAWARKLKA